MEEKDVGSAVPCEGSAVSALKFSLTQRSRREDAEIADTEGRSGNEETEGGRGEVRKTREFGDSFE